MSVANFSTAMCGVSLAVLSSSEALHDLCAQELTTDFESGPGRVSDVAKKHGISDATIYAWRKRYGQLESTDVKRLRQLGQENAKLKSIDVHTSLLFAPIQHAPTCNELPAAALRISFADGVEYVYQSA